MAADKSLVAYRHYAETERAQGNTPLPLNKWVTEVIVQEKLQGLENRGYKNIKVIRKADRHKEVAEPVEEDEEEDNEEEGFGVGDNPQMIVTSPGAKVQGLNLEGGRTPSGNGVAETLPQSVVMALRTEPVSLGTVQKMLAEQQQMFIEHLRSNVEKLQAMVEPAIDPDVAKWTKARDIAVLQHEIEQAKSKVLQERYNQEQITQETVELMLKRKSKEAIVVSKEEYAEHIKEATKDVKVNPSDVEAAKEILSQKNEAPASSGVETVPITPNPKAENEKRLLNLVGQDAMAERRFGPEGVIVEGKYVGKEFKSGTVVYHAIEAVIDGKKKLVAIKQDTLAFNDIVLQPVPAPSITPLPVPANKKK